MSTLNTARLESDDEDDGDFVPTASPRKTKKRRLNVAKRTDGSESDSSSGSGSDDDAVVEDEETKLLKAEQAEAEAAVRKKKAAELFASMKEESQSTTQKEKKSVQVEMVEIKRPRQFAGETIYETVSLPKDDPEVVAYRARQTQPEVKVPVETNGASTSDNKGELPTPPGQASPTVVPTDLLPRKGPLKRKPRQSLEAMSAALDKGKKMTTLEKSQMDWKSATSSDPSIQAELEANRRGGGYLEKQQFLDRVGERRTGTFEGRKGR